MISTFTLNGIDLDSNTYGWHLQAESRPKPGLSKRIVSVSGGGRDGNRPVPMSSDSPIVTLVVRVPEAGEDAFLALLGSSSLLLGYEAKRATVELLSATGELGLSFTDYTCVFRVSDMFWRDPAVATTTAAAIVTTTSNQYVIFSGLSAPIRDAIVRVKGGATNLLVRDDAGSFFRYNDVLPMTSWFRFERAPTWVVTSADVPESAMPDCVSPSSNVPSGSFPKNPVISVTMEPSFAIDVTSVARLSIERRTGRASACPPTTTGASPDARSVP